MLKENILLFAAHSAWGGASNFLDMFLEKKHNVVEINMEDPSRDGYNFRNDLANKKHIYDGQKISDFFSECEPRDVTYFIFDVLGFRLFQKFCNYNLVGFDLRDLSVNIFWSGNPYREDHEMMNEISRKLDFRQYCMLDLMRFNTQALPLMQPYDIQYLQKLRKRRTSGSNVVVHSPGHKGASNEKGTLDIDRFFQGKEYTYVKIGSSRKEHVSHESCLEKKSSCDIFIDKIGAHTAGGLGKSGIESICMGIPTICSMHHSSLLGQYSVLKDAVHDIREVSGVQSAIDQILGDNNYYCELSDKIKNISHVFSYSETYKYLNQTCK